MSDTKPARGRGRPRFEPTEAQRAQVLALKSTGVMHGTIAAIVKVPVRTLTRHFQRELSEGQDEVTGRIAFGLVSRALAGDNHAAMFYLKTRARWTTRHEVTGANGGPIDFRNLTTAEIAEALVALAEGGGEGDAGGGEKA